MKKFAISLCGVLGLLVQVHGARADGPHTYGGQQPWWNIFAHRTKLNPEEERLQRFWHDYYNTMSRFYKHLDRIDWVAYYKNHGYQINTGSGSGCYPGCGPCGGPQRIQFAPVMVTPNMQWMVPNASLCGPPPGPMGPPPGAFTGGHGAGFALPPFPPPGNGPPGYPPQGPFPPPGFGMAPPPSFGMGPPMGPGPMAGPPMGGPPMGGPMPPPPMGPMGPMGYNPGYGNGQISQAGYP